MSTDPLAAAEAEWQARRAARKRRRGDDDAGDAMAWGDDDDGVDGGSDATAPAAAAASPDDAPVVETYAQRRQREAARLAALQQKKEQVLKRVVEGEEDPAVVAEARRAADAAAASAAAAAAAMPQRQEVSLLEEATRLREMQSNVKVDAAAAAAEEEARLLEELTARRPLMGWGENAKGVVYDKPIETGWRAPQWLLAKDQQWVAERRKKHLMDVEGEDVPPPCARFKDMKLPRGIMNALAEKGILKPKPIQVQGLPVVLSGRDMIGIAFTGSGKTTVFAVPMVLRALQEEIRSPLVGGEGPISLVIVPSHELARQILDVVNHMIEHVARTGQPRLRSLLAIGGVDMAEQVDAAQDGVHIVVATPGRLQGLLRQQRINLGLCTLLALDEADRMIDVGFEEDMRNIMSFFSGQRQTIMFSATMPKKIQRFATSAMVKPVLVNVGRAGAASLDVVQDVQFIEREARIVELLNALRKTSPPVLIFAENKGDVDDIHEYLLLKGVRAVGVHGGKMQDERAEAVAQFLARKKHVLVATDVASKGLDFPGIKHVINFDMPKEIENYVHRIGRTGRNNRTGRATTFITDRDAPEILLDLKHLLVEAKQKVPAFLRDLHDEPDPALQAAAEAGVRECLYCSGLGHRVQNCPKLEAERRQNASVFSSANVRGE